MKKIVFFAIFMACIFSSCDEVRDLLPKELTNDEVIAGLKEALTIGAQVSSTKASSEDDGFINNSRIRIPLPEEVQGLVDALSFLDDIPPSVLSAAAVLMPALNVDITKQVSDLGDAINGAAQEAAKGAFKVFADVITGIDIRDGFDILKGDYQNSGDTAATHYLRINASNGLREEFMKVVTPAIASMDVITKFWEPLVSTYATFHNQYTGTSEFTVSLVANILGIDLPDIPPVPDQNLDSYITNRAIGGLMLLVGDQEKLIRDNPVGWGTELLERVFGKK